MRFLKNKVRSKMALMPVQHESSDEDEPKTVTTVKIEPVEEVSKPIKTPVKPVVKAAPVTKKRAIDFYEQYLNPGPPMFPATPGAQDLTVSNSNTKNIVKNYGKAMCSFAASNLATPYIECAAKVNQIKLDRFKEYFRCKKELVGSIESFRNLYMEDDTDSDEVKAFKRVFKEASIAFVKFFSVNWIFNGKLAQKQAHLKYRFKMLRRIKNPELFTYLKG